MKKLFNGRFLFILASSIVVLILLTVGAFYLFDETDDMFVKSGYVLNPLSSTSEKYFFNENVGYRENLSSMIEFVDVDENTVSVLKDSFLHYEDESLSFLKKGALLDLDTLKGDKAVSFYNITNESIIEKRDSGYFIESSVGDIRLINFIGRISDNKYIIVGNLNLKMAGNDTTINGDYFEVVYIEEGIVNIENKNVKYQVTADGTYINVGNDKVIDLGDKKITVNGEDVMSITSITIDGDENIEIIPKAKDEEDEPSEDVEVPGESGSGEDGSGTGEGGEGDTGSETVEPEDTEEIIVTLKDANIGSTDIEVVFEILNAQSDDMFKLQVVNLNSGRTVDIVAEVLNDAKIRVNLLSPNTKYLFTVINEKDNGKYFQKVFETAGFGIRLDKVYATDSSLSYKISIDEGTDITNAKLTLYKFNEETKQNEVVKTGFVDSVTGEMVYEEKITYLSDLTNLEGEHEVLYDGLDSDTIYTAVLDEFSLASVNFKDVYNITLTSMTLKKLPSFTEMTVEKNVGTGSFDLSLGNIIDPDNAIVGYTYVIYDKLTNEMAIEPIVQTNASPLNVKIGEGVNELKNDTNYYYKVIIEYFDNEKYIEYVTTDSITFMMGNDPYVTVVPNDELISHDSIGATIYLTDNSCLISMPDREKCGGSSTAVISVSSVNPLTGEKKEVHAELATFEVSLEEIKYELYVDGLLPGTTYSVDVKANFNNSDSTTKQDILHSDESIALINTKLLSSFELEWENYQSSANHVINATTRFTADENSGTLTPEESIATIDKVILKLYEGRKSSNMDEISPITTQTLNKGDGVNFKEIIYDNFYPITSDGTFGLNLDALKNKSTDGKLNEYYTIIVEAYTETGYQISLKKNSYSYKVSSLLLMEEISEPVIEVKGITNKSSGNLFPNLNNTGTYVGYSVKAAFDRVQLIDNKIVPKKINFYVYDTYGEKKDKLQFYILNENNELQLVDKLTASLGEDNFYEASIYMDYGTSYETVDDIMRRGNEFYIGYEIEVMSGNESLLYPVLDKADAPSDYGVYKKVLAEKETPSIKMFVAKSTENSITYRYELSDSDNAIYKETDSGNYGFYVTINSGEIVKYNMEKVDGSNVNKFKGDITIDGLSNGDLYSIYFLKNVVKTGEFSSDVLPFLHGAGEGIRKFDGYYSSLDFNFGYEVINDQNMDNKVTIKILAEDKMLSRIVNYELEFTDQKNNKLIKNLWKLNTCPGSSASSTPKCLSVDYTELRDAGMKSEGNQTNWISINVKALYDNGLTGFDFIVGNQEDADYPYTIMQGNSSELGMGQYLSFNSTGTQVTVWNEELDSQKGFYTYTLNGSMLTLKGQFGSKKSLPLVLSLNGMGYYSSSNSIYVNPKMISVDEMTCSKGSSEKGCNQFYFNSITPTVTVSEKSALLNGNVLTFNLDGLDSINDIKKENGKYYLYIETWENEDDVGNHDKIARPVLKVEIDSQQPNEIVITGTVDGLKNETNYYHNVYAWMNKNNNFVYTQLFDESNRSKAGTYEVKTYKFKTERVSNVFRTMTVSHVASDKIYGNRSLKTKFILKPYENYVPYNFDIVYVLCEFGAEDCGVGIGQNYIFKKTVPVENVSASFEDEIDISEYDLEYNKNYTMFIYASVDYYNTNKEDGIIKNYIKLNSFDNKVTFMALSEPTFTVTREAGIADGKYYIDLNVVVSDPDKTLVNGQYFVKLLDSDGNLAGTMQLKENGVYTDKSNYAEYAFDAFVLRKDIRITGLDPDSKYTFVVYNDAYMNNYCKYDDEGKECVVIPKEERTYEIRKSYTIYTTSSSGVAFGKNINYTATQKSIVLTFLGGSNFDNVVEVHYTAGMWGSEETSTYSGQYIIGKDGKYFEYNKDSDDWTFVITPQGMLNEVGAKYSVKVDFKIKDSNAADGYTWFSSEGEAVYQK